MRTLSRGLAVWDEVREQHGWPQIMSTDDLERGAKMVALTRHMMLDFDLAYGTITNYLWGVRLWMKLQHQADPCVGLIGWPDFMKAIV